MRRPFPGAAARRVLLLLSAVGILLDAGVLVQ